MCPKLVRSALVETSDTDIVLADAIMKAQHETVRYRRARLSAEVVETNLDLHPDPEGFVEADLEIANGRISDIAPHGSYESHHAIDLNYQQVWPSFVDIHAHLDISHTWPRSPNPDGSVAGARSSALFDRSKPWPSHDVERRMQFGIRAAYAHGVSAIRTHLNSNPVQYQEAWDAFDKVRRRWNGKIDLQATSLLSLQDAASDFGTEIADIVERFGGQLGAAISFTGQELTDLRGAFDLWVNRLFELAEQRNLDLDFHVDENGDPDANSLRRIATIALARSFKGRILCGHCCSLAVQPDQEVNETLTLCREAGIAIVSLPMCNLYLQDRAPRTTPRWRGITRLHEIAAQDIPLALGSDDVRNSWYSFGDQDMFEVFSQSAKIGHLDQPYGAWPSAVTATPARIMKLDHRGTIRKNGPADLVIFNARTMSELLARPQSDRLVLRSGHLIDTTLPDYRELDDLQSPIA